MKIISDKKMTDVFKPLKKGDRITCAYLYGDGHVAVCFERYNREFGNYSRYNKQAESVGVATPFEGRIVFHNYGGVSWFRAMLAAGATRFLARECDIDRGSENTKRLGIKTGFVEVETPFGPVYEYEFDCLSGAVTIQVGDSKISEDFNPNLEFYSQNDYPIVATYIARKPLA